MIQKLKQWKRNNLFKLIKENPSLITPKNISNSFFNMFNIPYRFPSLDTISLFVNKTCNAKCMMCDVGQQNLRGMDLYRSKQKNNELDMKLLKKILEDPYIAGKKINFSLIMTEPLLADNIFEIIRLIKSYGHKVVLATNGLLLPKKAKGLIEAEIDTVLVSLDGPEELHDKIRGGHEFYRNAIEGMKILNDSKVKVYINYTVFNQNYHSIIDFLDDINKQVKVDALKFRFMYFVSNEMKNKHRQTELTISKEVNPERVDVKKLSEQLKAITSHNYENIKKIDFVPYITSEKGLSKYFNLKGEKIESNSKCFYPWTHLFVTTDGKVRIHVICFDLIFGDLNDNNLKEIFEGTKFKDFRKKLIKADFCFSSCTRCCGTLQKYEVE